MYKRSPYVVWSATVALIGLLLSSTLIAWAARCTDCTAMQEMHGCCPDDRGESVGQHDGSDDDQSDARITARSCCDTQHTRACGAPASFDVGSATATQNHSNEVAARAGHIEVVALAPNARPAAAVPLPAPTSPPRTRTIVFLL
jgi:hypothetical protein